MKFKPKFYAQALAEVILLKETDDKKIINNFLKILVSKSIEKKSREILVLAEKIILARQGKKHITFETARKMTPDQRKILEAIAKKEDIITEKINKNLIAGIKIIINDSKQLDASMQSKLQNIHV